MILYEYPFNERIRTLLRLEDLYQKFCFFLQQEHPLQHQIALNTIFEMLDVAGRADLKSDLLQELERQKQALLAYRTNPDVETERLNVILADLERISATLNATQGKFGQNIRDNEWLMSVRGRTVISGGGCKFDVPSYYAWQQHHFERRREDISHWFAPLSPLFDALDMALRLLRDSGQSMKIIASSGSYQQMLQGRSFQMLRLKLDKELNAIPEISANKYMLWIRFTSQDGEAKPKAFEDEVTFTLTLCNF